MSGPGVTTEGSRASGVTKTFTRDQLVNEQQSQHCSGVPSDDRGWGGEEDGGPVAKCIKELEDQLMITNRNSRK